MTIVELRDRLTGIIENNKAHGWDERNSSDVVVAHKPSKRVTEYYPVKYACGAWLGIGTREQPDNVFELIIEDSPRARYGGKSH